jgi:hypothetical protein
MGRPLTDKWTGPRNAHSNPVLTPHCNINGTVGDCIILRQVGSNKFLVQNINTPSIVGRITLSNGDTNAHGLGYLAWSTLGTSGYVSKINDNTITTFTNGKLNWAIVNRSSNTTAYISSNSDD